MPANAVLKWHGGKQYLAAEIVKRMPRHIHYVEPYAGGAAVLLARDPNDESLWLPPHKGVSEVLNDLNGDLVNFWTVLSQPGQFEKFQRRVSAIPLSRDAFDLAERELERDDLSAVSRALAFFVFARQSRAGTFKGFTSLTRNRLRRGINGNASEWLGAIECLPAVHARLQPVVIENMDAIKLILREDAPGTLFYCDPPYLHETRKATDAYAHEMTWEQHSDLLNVLYKLQGKFMLSGYRSEMYDCRSKTHGWACHKFDLPNNAAGGKNKRRMTECLWCNF